MSFSDLKNKLIMEGYQISSTEESVEDTILLFKSNNGTNKRIELTVNNAIKPSIVNLFNNPTIQVTSNSVTFCLSKNTSSSISCVGANTWAIMTIKPSETEGSVALESIHIEIDGEGYTFPIGSPEAMNFLISQKLSTASQEDIDPEVSQDLIQWISENYGSELEVEGFVFINNNPINKRISVSLLPENQDTVLFAVEGNNPTIVKEEKSYSFCLSGGSSIIACYGATNIVKIIDDLDYGDRGSIPIPPPETIPILT